MHHSKRSQNISHFKYLTWWQIKKPSPLLYFKVFTFVWHVLWIVGSTYGSSRYQGRLQYKRQRGPPNSNNCFSKRVTLNELRKILSQKRVSLIDVWTTCMILESIFPHCCLWKKYKVITDTWKGKSFFQILKGVVLNKARNQVNIVVGARRLVVAQFSLSLAAAWSNELCL